MGFQAEHGPPVSRRIRSTRLLLGVSIGVAVSWRGQTHPILSRAIVVLVFSGPTLSAEVAVRDVYRPVHVRLVLAHPTVVVRARDRHL